MTYTVEVATDADEVIAAYPQVAHESMRCSPPDRSLHPDDDGQVEHFVKVGWVYVARDEAGTIRGLAVIHRDIRVGRCEWLTLPAEDGYAIMEALFDYYYDTTGLSVVGESPTASMVEWVSEHPKMTRRGETGVVWREGPING